ncbi:DUF6510 family protein [Promicromonospora thailandica]|uniref:Uncharacterized protein n=1 Tax=Promicromonospora thailandica TaxID=765201 RepID=A0A9X2G7C4_9MICO|nr:DUF6510 family protein [Promicromonospora thailandica]MCP2263241.1 hypothetical protein [Promicromonospora thailandica]BFF18630.1 DUF6510 family protein [Promicromonospora thailandica]
MTHHLDGNVLAGALSEVFASDVTAARGRCAGCGQTSPIAEAMVYTDAPGLVARCAGCDQVLATLVDAGDRVILSLAGLTAVELRR